MQRKGIRSRRSNTAAVPAARTRSRFSRQVSWILLLSALPMSVGCSLLERRNGEVIKVESKIDTARAGHLTRAGIHALNKQHIDIAAKKFREAIATDYTYGPAHNNLGLMHYEQGNLYQAVMAFEQAREYLPEDPAVAYNLGLALESAGRTDEALELYYAANAMDRANPNYLGNLVRLRVRMGEHDELLEHQLQELALIETRPDWRRWTDIQLALVVNPALDRGPATPDLESTANQSNRPQQQDLENKIIDLTPVAPASHEEPIEEPSAPGESVYEALPDEPPAELEPPMDLSPPNQNGEQELGSMLKSGAALKPNKNTKQPAKPKQNSSVKRNAGLNEREVEDLSKDDYFR